MTPLLYIRTHIFRTSQEAMADIAGVSQATVSRWEAGHFEPNGKRMERIRGEALKRKIKWNDAWFFEAPARAPAKPTPASQGASA